MKLRRPLYARPEIIRGQHCIRDALLAPTGRNKQQQVAAELWLWAGLPHSGEAPGSVMADIHGHFTEAPGWALALTSGGGSGSKLHGMQGSDSRLSRQASGGLMMPKDLIARANKDR